MTERIYRWTKKRLRQQLEVVRGEQAPSLVLKNATYLNHARKKWLQANIWIAQDRIVYVGDDLPNTLDGTEIVDCSDQYIVPGYIEHHAHPFQLYNPHSFAKYAASRGTTTLINDNMMFFLNLEKKKALSLIEALDELPTSMYWWCRYDAQTELKSEEAFSNSKMKAWLEHHLVIQGGELTSWPKVLTGDDATLHWMQETTRLRKPIEGHLPGASEKTLSQMALLGVTCDHEAMTGEEVVRRLNLGYTTSLRHSSIRPDLPKLLKEMQELGVDVFDRCIMTTDGSTPTFYEDGVMDHLIKIALDAGIEPIDAYAMATYNVAKYYNLDHKLGMIAPGRVAHLNFLNDINDPKPTSVIAKGQWVVRDGRQCEGYESFPWEDYGIEPLKIDWELKEDDLHFSMPMGIEMVNAVILKPYQIPIECTDRTLSQDHDESFFVMLDKNGKWLITSMLKGFANRISGFASSFSNTGDIVLIGKNISDMVSAFNALKEQGGGMALVEDGEVIGSIPLKLFGMLSNKNMNEVIKEEKEFVGMLRERGYKHEDPIYSLLFFSSTHLPYIRVTQSGIYDVHKKTVLFPSIMR
ncbi:amidohydrolase family protein [Alkalihalophilus marmarensis]|jgi:adenine deaminase|uniref:adenine deaminase n=1 Tax=Alkalihalophilus marmarensis DSM 21297 TaxID=1188261 RepID=U6SL64_9BACI|nr:adenine deaminase C-terminal domain-containing protein [Alkalihalophilus marmarensis]ERN51351.1 adenine deaminase [Alkalihalophilus marmarensis DSM 21297]MCM3490434.1 amidohydrolase family protein [Alkalihalophilus marmarensis]